MFENFENDFLTVSFADSDDMLACYVKYSEDENTQTGLDLGVYAFELEELEAECSKAFGFPCTCDFIDVGEDGEEVYAVSKS